MMMMMMATSWLETRTRKETFNEEFFDDDDYGDGYDEEVDEEENVDHDDYFDHEDVFSDRNEDLKVTFTEEL